MSAEWYYVADEVQYGPFSLETMRQHASEGRLHRQDYVWREGFEEWVEAETVQGVFDAGQAVPPPRPGGTPVDPPRGDVGEKRHWDMDTPTFCMLIHFSQFASITFPLAGTVLPIVMWATEKEDCDEIDEHGRNVVNWLISSAIYIVMSIVLMIVGVGFITLLIVLVLAFVYPIIGGIKAKNGTVWRYPLAIRFL